MPLYEYVCEKCRKKTEVIQRMGERPLRVCPHCGGKLKKAFSAPAIQFKGSGFYITDYARGSGESGGAKSEKGESKSESKGESKGESKSESKSETKSESAGKSEKVEKKDRKEKRAAKE